MACSLSVTQDGDVGAISSPFFRLRMRSGGIDREGGLSQRAVRKTQKHLGLCVLFSNTYTHQILIEFESVVI